ncbi:MAG: type II toxin-antitoxin system HicB family antitoxin [Planctomycetota bacterium]
MDWRIVVRQDPETGDWAAWCPELPGCASAGETEEEAIENIKEAIALYLEPSPVELEPGSKTRVVTMP